MPGSVGGSQADESETDQGKRKNVGGERLAEEGGRKGRNKSDQQRASLSEKNRLYWGDFGVRELSTERWSLMKPSESE